MGKLAGRTAIVTGAAVGIGRDVAVALAAEGASVAVNYSRSEADAAATVALIREAGGRAEAFRADVSDDAQVRAMVESVEARLGGIDILVNNAGITSRQRFDDLEALTGEMWSRLYDVNVKGMFFCCRAVVPAMRKRGGGRIINIASVAGIRPSGSSIAYCASKAAMIHAGACLAKALAPDIRVNTIAPGFIDETRWNVDVEGLDKLRANAAAATPLQRVGLPSDITETALFLAAGADFMTGAVLVVDGGRQLTQ
ncbi:MAG TPA: glucose 1-dehydrogenase [Geminicoccaceae bacterium]|nr:glucose 1-dehydrogenase [Geminicoccus sp.]HMU49454.1 glucose 1-dehydrogenase [Geminicoccaceae bacterium]